MILLLRCTGEQIFAVKIWVSADDNSSTVHIKKMSCDYIWVIHYLSVLFICEFIVDIECMEIFYKNVNDTFLLFYQTSAL